MGYNRRGGKRANWTDLVRENEAWEQYYKAQGLVSEADFEALKAAFQRDLPLTFRITGTRRHALDVRRMLEDRYLPTLKGVQWEGQEIEAPAPLSFYPDNLGWQLSVPKQVIRKNEAFAHLQRFLVTETAVGNISRQEAVSMIPTLLLDVRPHHVVLDTCASPGSKTVQLIEALHQDGDRPTGVVIANDSDYKRSHMLTHQVKRLNSANVIVTNHDAQMYPKIRRDSSSYLKFDRILCDVPCSGDGTMRKNVMVWNDWKVGNGLGLHQTQVNIAARGIQMLKPGGKLVYSTCSLNPIEDEAVVAQILRQFKDVTLVDVSDQLLGLKRSPGTRDWKVQAKDREWKTLEDSGMPRSLFPPTSQEADAYNLERSIRVYPHQQDTGGFFIAVLEKASKADEEPAAKKSRTEEQEAADSTPVPEPAPKNTPASDEPVAKVKLPRDAMEEPFHFLDPQHPEVQSCWEFYDIKDSFPRNTLVVRNQTGEPLRTIYYVPPAVREIIELNDNKLKFIYAGIKLFTQQKNEGACRWRVQSDGIALLYPHVGSRRVVKSEKLEMVKHLCNEEFPRFDGVQKLDPELHAQVIKLEEGCCFFEVGGVVYPLWRGRASVNLMVSKDNAQELLLRFFGIEPVKKTAKPVADQPEAKNESKEAINPALSVSGSTPELKDEPADQASA